MWGFFTFCTFRDSMFTLKNSVIAKKESCFQFKTKVSLWITIVFMLWIVSFVKNFTPVIYGNRVLIFLSKMRVLHYLLLFHYKYFYWNLLNCYTVFCYHQTMKYIETIISAMIVFSMWNRQKTMLGRYWKLLKVNLMISLISDSNLQSH